MVTNFLWNHWLPGPNGRQLDGMGGGISSLSKVCVVGPFTVAGADVDYTFAAIGVKNLDVDDSSILREYEECHWAIRC